MDNNRMDQHHCCLCTGTVGYGEKEQGGPHNFNTFHCAGCPAISSPHLPASTMLWSGVKKQELHKGFHRVFPWRLLCRPWCHGKCTGQVSEGGFWGCRMCDNSRCRKNQGPVAGEWHHVIQVKPHSTKWRRSWNFILGLWCYYDWRFSLYRMRMWRLHCHQGEIRHGTKSRCDIMVNMSRENMS